MYLPIQINCFRCSIAALATQGVVIKLYKSVYIQIFYHKNLQFISSHQGLSYCFEIELINFCLYSFVFFIFQVPPWLPLKILAKNYQQLNCSLLQPILPYILKVFKTLQNVKKILNLIQQCENNNFYCKKLCIYLINHMNLLIFTKVNSQV